VKFVGAYERKATIGMDVDQHQCCTRKSKRIAEASKLRLGAVLITLARINVKRRDTASNPCLSSEAAIGQFQSLATGGFLASH
jgi:hypothetical protein